MEITTVDPAKSIPVHVGVVVGDVFVKHVQSSKHRLRMFPAYGIQKDVFDDLPKLGVERITIHEDDKVVYTVTYAYWKAHGKEMDLGNGMQNFLSLKFMDGGEKSEKNIHTV